MSYVVVASGRWYARDGLGSGMWTEHRKNAFEFNDERNAEAFARGVIDSGLHRNVEVFQSVERDELKLALSAVPRAVDLEWWQRAASIAPPGPKLTVPARRRAQASAIAQFYGRRP